MIDGSVSSKYSTGIDIKACFLKKYVDICNLNRIKMFVGNTTLK